MTEPRKYRSGKRAAQKQDTRRRIVEAAVELHRTVGPAATQINEIARRAGVQRVTVYSHFPDERALLSACSAHWRHLHPAPDPASLLVGDDEHRKLRAALRALYAWYRETEPMTAHVLRDAETMPNLRRIIDAGLGRFLETLAGLIVDMVRPPAARRPQVIAAVNVVIGLHAWQAFAPLGDDEAAELAARCVEAAIQP